MADAPGRPRFHALDALRGLSAVAVCAYHFRANSHVAGWMLVRHGWLFVDFFFVLSGFVITLAYRDALAGRVAFGRFAIRRLARIYPMHLLMLALFLAFELLLWAWPSLSGRAAFTGMRSPSGLMATALLGNSFGLTGVLAWNTPSWSISAEYWTYMLFGLLILGFGRRGILLLLACGVASLLLLVAWQPSIYATFSGGLLRCIAGFATGSACSFAWPYLFRRSLGLAERWATLIEVALVGMVMFFVAFLATTAWSFLAPLLFAVVVLAFAAERGRLSGLLKSAPMLAVGVASYSIYMIQFFVQARLGEGLQLVERIGGLAMTMPEEGTARPGMVIVGSTLWQGDLLTLLMLSLVIGLAMLSQHFVERPGQALGHAIAGRIGRSHGMRPADTGKHMV